mgnify:CR=1
MSTVLIWLLVLVGGCVTQRCPKTVMDQGFDLVAEDSRRHISDATCKEWIRHPVYQGYERRRIDQYDYCYVIDDLPGVFCCPK